MKKSIILITVLSFLMAFNTQAKLPNTNKVLTLDGNETILGKVSAVKYRVYSAKAANDSEELEINRDKGFTYEYTYDDSGNLTKAVFRNYSGSPKFIYDNQGNRLKIIGGNDAYSFRTPFDDRYGDVTQAYFVYDEQGNRIQSIWKDDSQEMHFFYENIYDKKGNIIRRIYRTADDTTGNSKEFIYKRGKVTNIISKDYYGKIQGVTVLKYGLGKNITKSTYMDKRGKKLNTMGYTYGIKGNIKTRILKSGYPHISEHIDKYEYDKQGNLTMKISKDESGTTIFQYSYEFDDHGNYIKRIEKKKWMNKDKRITIESYNVTEREIICFE